MTSNAEPWDPALLSTELHLNLSDVGVLMVPLPGVRNLAMAQMVLSPSLMLISSLFWLPGPIYMAVSPQQA